MTRGACRARVRTAIAAGLLALGAASDAAEVSYVLAIANGKVPSNMRLIRVKQNDVVKLKWSTDKLLSVHLHGYDIEQKVKPGTVTEMSFTARATGRFTIEPHVGKTQSGGHAHGDALVTIEVYP